mgnify:CR=1 FL=1
MYNTVPAKIDLPEMEHEVLDLWKRQDIFHKSLAPTMWKPESLKTYSPATAP